MAFGFSAKNGDDDYLITEQTSTPAFHSLLINADTFTTILSDFGGSFELEYKVYDCPSAPLPFFTMPIENRSYAISKIAPDTGDADWKVTLITNQRNTDRPTDLVEPPLAFEPTTSYLSDDRLVEAITTTELDFVPIKPTDNANTGSETFTVGAVYKVPRQMYIHGNATGSEGGNYFVCEDVSSYNTVTGAHTPFIQNVLEPLARVKFTNLCDSGKEVSYKLPISYNSPSDLRLQGLPAILQFNGGDLSYKGGSDWSGSNPEYPNATAALNHSTNLENDLLGAVKYNFARGADNKAGVVEGEYYYNVTGRSEIYITEWAYINVKVGQYIQFLKEVPAGYAFTGWLEVLSVNATERTRTLANNEVESFDSYYLEVAGDQRPLGSYVKDTNNQVRRHWQFGGDEDYSDLLSSNFGHSPLSYRPSREGKLWKGVGFFVRGWPSASITWGTGSTTSTTFSADFDEHNIDFFPIPTNYALTHHYNSYNHTDSLEPDTGLVQTMAARDALAFQAFADIRGLPNATTRSATNPFTSTSITVDKYIGTNANESWQTATTGTNFAAGPDTFSNHGFKPQWWRTPYLWHGAITNAGGEAQNLGLTPRFTQTAYNNVVKPTRLGKLSTWRVSGGSSAEYSRSLPSPLENNTTTVDIDVFLKGNSSTRILNMSSLVASSAFSFLHPDMPSVPGQLLGTDGSIVNLLSVKNNGYGSTYNDAFIFDKTPVLDRADCQVVINKRDRNGTNQSGPEMVVFDYINTTASTETDLGSPTALTYVTNFNPFATEGTQAGKWSILSIVLENTTNGLTVTIPTKNVGYTSASFLGDYSSFGSSGGLRRPQSESKIISLPDYTGLELNISKTDQFATIKYTILGEDLAGQPFNVSATHRLHRFPEDTSFTSPYGSHHGITNGQSTMSLDNIAGNVAQNQWDPEDGFDKLPVGIDLTRCTLREYQVGNDPTWLGAYPYVPFGSVDADENTNSYYDEWRAELGTHPTNYGMVGLLTNDSTFLLSLPTMDSLSKSNGDRIAHTGRSNIDRLMVLQAVDTVAYIDYKNSGLKYRFDHLYNGSEYKTLRYPTDLPYSLRTAENESFYNNRPRPDLDIDNKYRVTLSSVPNISKNVSAVSFSTSGRQLNTCSGISEADRLEEYVQENILSSTVKAKYISGNSGSLDYLSSTTTAEAGNPYNVPGIFDPEVNPDNEELIYIGLGSNSLLFSNTFPVKLENTHTPNTVLTRPVSLALSCESTVLWDITVPSSIPFRNIFLFVASGSSLKVNGVTRTVPASNGSSSFTLNGITVNVKRSAAGRIGTRFGTPYPPSDGSNVSHGGDLDKILGLNHQFNYTKNTATVSQTNSTYLNYLGDLTSIKPTSINCAYEAKEVTVAVTSRFCLSSPEILNKTKPFDNLGYEVLNDFFTEDSRAYHKASNTHEYPYLKFSGVSFETDLSGFNYGTVKFPSPSVNTNNEEVLFVGTQTGDNPYNTECNVRVDLSNGYNDANATDFVDYTSDPQKHALVGGAPTRNVSLVLSAARNTLWTVKVGAQVKLTNIYFIGLGNQRLVFDNGTAHATPVTLYTGGSTQITAGTYPTSTLTNNIAVSRHSTQICGYTLPSKSVAPNNTFGGNILENTNIFPSTPTLTATNVNVDKILGANQTNIAYPSGSNPSNVALFYTWTGKYVTNFTAGHNLKEASFSIKIGSNGKEIELASSGSGPVEQSTDTYSTCSLASITPNRSTYPSAGYDSTHWINAPSGGVGTCGIASECNRTDAMGYGSSQTLARISTDNQDHEVIVMTAYNAGSIGIAQAQIDFSTNVLTKSSHGLVTGEQVGFKNTIILSPSPVYFVHRLSSSTLKLARSYNDAIAGTNLVDFTTSGQTYNNPYLTHYLYKEFTVDVENLHNSFRKVTLVVSIFNNETPVHISLPSQNKVNLQRVIILNRNANTLTFNRQSVIDTYAGDSGPSTGPRKVQTAAYHPDGSLTTVETSSYSVAQYEPGTPNKEDDFPYFSNSIDRLFGFNRTVISDFEEAESNPLGLNILETYTSLGTALRATTWVGASYAGQHVDISLADTIDADTFSQYEAVPEPASNQILDTDIISSPGTTNNPNTNFTSTGSFDPTVSTKYKNVGKPSTGSGLIFRKGTSSITIINPGEGYIPQGNYYPGSLAYEIFAIRVTDCGEQAFTVSDLSGSISSGGVNIGTHYLSTGDMVNYYSTTTDTLTNLTQSSEYYVSVTGNSIKLHNSKIDAISGTNHLPTIVETASGGNHVFTPLILIAPINVSVACPIFARDYRTLHNTINTRGFSSTSLNLTKTHEYTNELATNSTAWVHDGFVTTPNEVQTLYRSFVPSVASYMGAIDNINGFNIQPYQISEEEYDASNNYTHNSQHLHTSAYNSTTPGTSPALEVASKFFSYNNPVIRESDTFAQLTGTQKYETEYKSFTLSSSSNPYSFATRHSSYSSAWTMSFSENTTLGYRTVDSLDMPFDATGFIEARYGFLDSAATYTQAIYWEGALVATNSANPAVALPATNIPANVNNPSAEITGITVYSSGGSPLSSGHEYYDTPLGRLTLNTATHGFVVSEAIVVEGLTHSNVSTTTLNGTCTVVFVSGTTVYYTLKDEVHFLYNATAGIISGTPTAINNPYKYFTDKSNATVSEDFIFAPVRRYGPDYAGLTKIDQGTSWNSTNIPKIYIFTETSSVETQDTQDQFGLQVRNNSASPILFDSRTIPLLISESGDSINNFTAVTVPNAARYFLSAKYFSNHSIWFTPTDTRNARKPSGSANSWRTLSSTHNNSAYFLNSKAQSHVSLRVNKTDKKSDCPFCSRRTYYYTCEYWALYRPGIEFAGDRIVTKYITVSKGALRTKTKQSKGAFNGNFPILGSGEYDYYVGGLNSWNNETINTANEKILTVNTSTLGLSTFNITMTLREPGVGLVSPLYYRPHWRWNGGDSTGANTDSIDAINIRIGDTLNLTVDFITLALSHPELVLDINSAGNWPSDNSTANRKVRLMSDIPWHANNPAGTSYLNYTLSTNAQAEALAVESSSVINIVDIPYNDPNLESLVFSPKKPGTYYVGFLTFSSYSHGVGTATPGSIRYANTQACCIRIEVEGT